MRDGEVDEAVRVLEVRKYQPKAITFSCERLPCGWKTESKVYHGLDKQFLVSFINVALVMGQ